MAVERQVRRLLRRTLFWRLVGDLIGLPATVLNAVAGGFRMLERACFIAELHYARRYWLLTGDDLPLAMGDADRYRGLRLGQEELSRRFGDG